ncbi:Transcription initiation factor TFIID subunit 9 [Plasmodiophora brassicae]
MGDEDAEDDIANEVPRDAICIDAILRSMGVVEYEPKIVNQLLEFMHRHVLEILGDAQMYQQHSGRQKIDISDIRMAIQTKMNFCFLQPPQREVLHAVALERNRQPLPVVNPDRVGLRLPNEKLCLLAANYDVKPRHSH